MNREDIIRMAREAGFWIDDFERAAGKDCISATYHRIDDQLERFAALVAAAERESWPAEMEAMERQVNILTDALAQAKAEEREACAKVCEQEWNKYCVEPSGYALAVNECAAAIRARSK